MWSNVVAAGTLAVVAAGDLSSASNSSTLNTADFGLPAGAGSLDLPLLPLALMLLSMSCFYIGGMFLNDAFDAAIDAAERPERPIPSGQVGLSAVYVAGFGLLLLGVALTAWVASMVGHPVVPAVVSAILLGAAIVAYNVHHKQNPFSPVIMGLCRVLVYTTTALVLGGSLALVLLLAALVLWLYLIGLTAIAKQENLAQVRNLWPLLLLLSPVLLWLSLWGVTDAANLTGSLTGLLFLVAMLLTAWVGYALMLLRRRQQGGIPRAVVTMIAGISLVDALAIAAISLPLTLLCLLAFIATLALQRFVSGT